MKGKYSYTATKETSRAAISGPKITMKGSRNNAHQKAATLP